MAPWYWLGPSKLRGQMAYLGMSQASQFNAASNFLMQLQRDLDFNKDFRDQYVMLDRIDVHCVWVSDRVLSLLPTPLPDVPGGEIPARGIFCDNAMNIVLEHYPKPGRTQKSTFVKNAMRELNKLGIVGMHDAGVVPENLDLYNQLSRNIDWTVRVYAMIECDVRNTFCPDQVKKISTHDGKFHVQSVKLFGGMYFHETLHITQLLTYF